MVGLVPQPQSAASLWGVAERWAAMAGGRGPLQPVALQVGGLAAVKQLIVTTTTPYPEAQQESMSSTKPFKYGYV